MATWDSETIQPLDVGTIQYLSKEESNHVLSYGMALMINIAIWGALQRSIRIFMAGLIGITLLLWLQNNINTLRHQHKTGY